MPETLRRPRLAFISPLFLFPNDAGGKIRTTNILRGLKGGAFEIVLVSVASPEQVHEWRSEIDGICDEFIAWAPEPPRPDWRRVLDLQKALPVNVVVDRTQAGLAAVQAVAARDDIDVIVFDFVHSAALRPPKLKAASLCFTHNVEAEIFERHAKQAKDPLRRWVWSSQFQKMRRFETQALNEFDTVIAVSERDAEHFRSAYGVRHARAIPTGVDLEFFQWHPVPEVSGEQSPTVVFTASMNSAANIDGIRFFLEKVWPLVLQARPDAQFKAIGKAPPPALTQWAKQVTRNVTFTGFVDDVRPHVRGAHVFVIPLLVGGGTRIKAFEAMAMGCPIVSTEVGIEGLEAEADRHYLSRDTSEAMAAGVLELLESAALRERLSTQGRRLVEERFGHRVASQVFEQICLEALARQQEPGVATLAR